MANYQAFLSKKGSISSTDESDRDNQLILHDEALEQENSNSNVVFLDLDKPLMPQVIANNWTKDYYLREVYRARHLPRPAVLFPNPLLEMLTRTPWYVVPIFWLPLVALCFYYSYHGLQSKIDFWCVFFSGLFGWTFLEYMFHRFWFHVDRRMPDHPWCFIVHFLMHGFHHLLPMDRYRLVMPPALMLSLSAPWWFVIGPYILTPNPAHKWAAFAGVWLGYVCYDMFHYQFHHGRPSAFHLRHMKRVHLAHHYGPVITDIDRNTTVVSEDTMSKAESEIIATTNFEGDIQTGFGVTVEFWDIVFGTQQPLKMVTTG